VSGTAYLDASAAVKLLVNEPESSALTALLSAADLLISSEILVVELACFVNRRGSNRAAERQRRLLRQCELVAFLPELRDRAAAPFTPPQRALDAIHLATALHLGTKMLAFVSYDHQQLAAAEASGLSCRSPA